MLSAEHYFGNLRWSKKQKVFTFHLREKCPFCKKSFTNANRLKHHIITSHHLHSKDETRKYKCSICPKSFKLKHHLKEHMNIHTGAKPYKCQNCNRSFAHSGSLSAHVSNKKCQNEENVKENTNEIKNKVYFETVQPQKVVSTSTSTYNNDRNVAKNQKSRNKTRSSNENQFMFKFEDVKSYNIDDEKQVFVKNVNTSSYESNKNKKNIYKSNIKQEKRYEKYINAEKGLRTKFEVKNKNNFNESFRNDGKKQNKKKERRAELQQRSVSLCNYSSKNLMEKEEESAANAFYSGRNKSFQEKKLEKKIPKLSESYNLSQFIKSTGLESFNKDKKKRFSGKDESFQKNGTLSPFLQDENNDEPEKSFLYKKPEDLFEFNKNSNNNSLNPKLSFPAKLNSVNNNLQKNYSTLFGQQTSSHLQNSAFQMFTPPNLQQNPQNSRNSFFDSVYSQSPRFNITNQLPFQNNFNFNTPIFNQPPNPFNPNLRNFSIASCAKEILENQTKMLHLNVPGPSSSFLESYNFWYQMIIANECARILKAQSYFQNITSPLQNPLAFNMQQNKTVSNPVSPLGSTASSQGSFVNSAISPNTAGVSTYLNSTMTSCKEDYPTPQRDQNGMYKCSLCSKSIKTWTSFKRHIDDHKGIRRHECPHCDKKFKHKHHLTEHIRLHTGEKPFQCKKCGKSFSHSGSYSQHMNSKYPNCSPQDNLRRKAPKRKYVEAPVDLSRSKPDFKKICLQKNY